MFASSCSACHSLVGDESLHRPGGDLRVVRFSREILSEYAAEMPVHPPLSARELAAVVGYVYAVEHR